MKKTRVAVLGSTGSVGEAALDVIHRLGCRFELAAIAARRSIRRLAAQVRKYRPQRVVVSSEEAHPPLRALLKDRVNLQSGNSALIDLASAPDIDIVVMAMSGTDGLFPVLAALKTGKRLALATKELLVGFGNHILKAARRGNGELLPVDSELAAIHQCIAGRPTKSVARLILTASGGPFWRSGIPRRPTMSQVLRHPTWSMGRKISVDSATMMNKGLEIIEAVRLFEINPEQVEVVVHPQSIVHALVELADGSVIGQLSTPDMRLPIQYCLTYPARFVSPIRHLDLSQTASLNFFAPDAKRFPCLSLARQALKMGGAAPCALIAADEVAVEAFLERRIPFASIPLVIRKTLAAWRRRSNNEKPSLKQLLKAQSEAIAVARRYVNQVQLRTTRHHRRD